MLQDLQIVPALVILRQLEFFTPTNIITEPKPKGYPDTCDLPIVAIVSSIHWCSFPYFLVINDNISAYLSSLNPSITVHHLVFCGISNMLFFNIFSGNPRWVVSQIQQFTGIIRVFQIVLWGLPRRIFLSSDIPSNQILPLFCPLPNSLQQQDPV